MSVAVRRTVVMVVLALVTALVAPLSAGATALPDDVASVDGTATDDVAPDTTVVEDVATEEALAGAESGVSEQPGSIGLAEALSPPGSHDAEAPPEDTPEQGEVDGSHDRDGSESAQATMPEKATHVAVGWEHMLHLDDDGQIWAWGRNNHGQLGNNTTTDSSVPVKVDMTGALEGVDVVAVSASWWHSMALDAEGRVYTWGRNVDGVLGDGTTTTRTSPVRVRGVLEGERVLQIRAAGSSSFAEGAKAHSVAVNEHGQVFTWGSGTGGRLGILGPSEVEPRPIRVAGPIASLRIVDVAVGQRHTVVLAADGRIFSWGERSNGVMGDGGAEHGSQPLATPLKMDGALAGVRVVQVSAGNSGSRAISDDGEIFAWGTNLFGQLGDGTTVRALEPVRADMAAFDEIGHRPQAVATSSLTSFSLGEGGRVAAWGNSTRGELGNGSMDQTTLKPVEAEVDAVLGGTSIVQIAAGGYGVLALARDGRLVAWGQGTSGQLGDGQYQTSPRPVQVGGLRVVTDPTDLDVLEGEPAAFDAESDRATAAVRWQSSTDGRTWVTIEGATSGTLTIDPARREMTGMRFRAAFTGRSEFPVASGAATLTVEPVDPPTITEHPVGYAVSLVDLDVTLNADAVSRAPTTMVWQLSSDDGATWSDIEGATEKAHTFTASEELHGAQLRAVFTNIAGEAVTDTTRLEVVVRAPRADLVVAPTSRMVPDLRAA